MSRRAGPRPEPRTRPHSGGEHAPGGARRNREKGTEGPRSPEVVFRKPFRRRLPVKVVRRQPSPNPFPGGSSPETGPRKGADEGRFALAVPGLVNALPKRPPGQAAASSGEARTGPLQTPDRLRAGDRRRPLPRRSPCSCRNGRSAGKAGCRSSTRQGGSLPPASPRTAISARRAQPERTGYGMPARV